MRRAIIAYFLATALCSGCAYEGVIVEKRFRPLPFPDSLGVDAMYNFQLRDSVGKIHSQMVTANVFASYRVGDYFNDLQLPPSREDKEIEGFAPAPRELNQGPYQPVRVLQIRQPGTPTSKVAVRVHHHAKHSSKIAKAHDHTKHASKIAGSHHRTNKRAKVANKHRMDHLKVVASAN
jgi:hypothetical protein